MHRYLTFERARFGERLQVEERVDDGMRSLEVPAFILQPLVENSVKHGVRPGGAVRITIDAWRGDGGDYIVEVEDDGVGIKDEDLPKVLEIGYGSGFGIALANVNDRLQGHFGEESGLEVHSTEGAGTRVRIRIAGQVETDGVEDATEGSGM